MKTFKHSMTIHSFGVDIVLKSNAKRFLDAIPKTMDSALGGLYVISDGDQSEHVIEVDVRSGVRIDISQNYKLKYVEKDMNSAMSRVEASIRLIIAEFAVGKVFIHSGAVSWKGKGIIFPARSFKGKSSLTAALVRGGARYFSDEYAVVDGRGLLHPFPKDLSLRGMDGSFAQIDHPVETIGGLPGKRAVAIKLILITQFARGAKWQPRRMSQGAAAMEMLNNSVAIRRDPNFVLPVLTKVSSSAIALKTKRGEADEAAAQILELVSEIED